MINFMADYSDIESAINDRLANGDVVEYEIGNGRRRVRYNTSKDALFTSTRLAGLAHRQANDSLLRPAKLQEPSE